MILSIVSPRVISFSPNIPDSHEVDRVPRGHNGRAIFAHHSDIALMKINAHVYEVATARGRPAIGVEVKGRLSERQGGLYQTAAEAPAKRRNDVRSAAFVPTQTEPVALRFPAEFDPAFRTGKRSILRRVRGELMCT